jgi:hypothetical protein
MGRRGPVFCAGMFMSSSGTTVLTMRRAASGCQLRAAAQADMPRQPRAAAFDKWRGDRQGVSGATADGVPRR